MGDGRRGRRSWMLLVMLPLAASLCAAPACAQGPDPLRQAHDYKKLLGSSLTVRGEAPSSAIAEAYAKYEDGDFKGARAEMEKVIAQERAGGDRAREATAVDFLGVLFQRQGLLDDAADRHRRALDLVDGQTGGPARAARLAALNNLAIVHYYRGEHDAALETLTKIIEAPDASELTKARAVNNRGLVREELGQFSEARADFDTAKGKGAADPRLRAAALNNQARVYGREGNLLDAEPLLEQAARLAAGAGDQALEANILDSWGEVLIDNGKAIEGLRKLDAAQAKLPPALIALTIDRSRAKALLSGGRLAEALAVLDQVIAQAGARALRVPAIERQALKLRGDVRMAMVQGGGGSLDAAIADYRSAIEIAEKTRDRAPRERLHDFVKSMQALYEATIRALTRRGNPEDIEEAATLFGNIATLTLHGELQAVEVLRSTLALRAVQGARGVLAQESALQSQLADAVREGATPEQIDKLREELDGARRAVAVAVSELVQKYGALYRAYVTISPLQFRDIRDQLPPGHLLVGYLPMETELYVFLVSRGDPPQFRQLPVKKQDLDEQIRQWRLLTTRVSGSRSDWAIDDWNDPKWARLRDATSSLYRTLVEPIRSLIDRADHVVFAPTGLLYYLPLHALGPYDARSGDLRYLIIDKPVSYLTDNSLLKALGPPSSRTGPLLALGNPPYRHPGLSQLKYAEDEVRDIKTVFGSSSLDLVGSAATKSALYAALGSGAQGTAIARRAADTPRFSFVHLATHGTVAARSADSWLALEGTNKLVASEIPDLDLRGVGLVTLSACKTGIAEDSPGAELMSLATFFGQAGASSIVVTLWSVDDRSTGALMKSFYQSLVQAPAASKAQALRAAQVAFATRPDTRHPFFWAAFVMIGDWR